MDEQWRREVLDLHQRALEGRLQQRARLEPQQIASLIRAEQARLTPSRPPTRRRTLDGDTPDPGWCNVVTPP